MLYKILLFPARIFIHFYFRKIIISDKNLLQKEGPLLIASNHPNSFLDAIVLATLFKKPIYSLARGDAFAGKFITKILCSLNMLPVYRVSEGVENLEHNYTTFDACQHIFKKNGIILIFSEGKCINEWHLRPLKKGTARLALAAWQNNIPLKVLATGINYNSFRNFCKTIIINFGDVITKDDASHHSSFGKSVSEFNEKLQLQLKQLVFEIDKTDTQKFNDYFSLSQSLIKKILLFIPAIIGFIINAPLYYLIHFSIKEKATEHYDSIMLGILFLFYPVYVIAITIIVFFITKSMITFFLLLLIPFTALSLLHFKTKNPALI